MPTQSERTVHEDFPGATAFVPKTSSLTRLASAARQCRGCDLYQHATQTVFGSGPKNAPMALIGEQPGDVEDREGQPFVGPAGRVLDRALAELGLDRSTVYLTNVVKHFRWRSTDRGTRRIHQKPDSRHIEACTPWLQAELRVVQPKVLVALGAVAAQHLLGRSVRVTKSRGAVLPWPPDSSAADQHIVATIHPSAVLRSDDREAAFAGFVADLAVAVKAVDMT